MNAIALDELILAFRSIALETLSAQADVPVENGFRKGGKAGDAVGAGQADTMLLWRDASKSEILTSLRETATQMLRRISKALTSALHNAAEELMTLLTEHWVPSSPHQELIPWCGWLRAVASRRISWLIAYPEEEYLHP